MVIECDTKLTASRAHEIW